MQTGTWTCALLVALSLATNTRAQSAEPEPLASRVKAPLHALGVNMRNEWLDAKDYGYGAELAYRVRLPSELQLGAQLAVVAIAADRIGGYAADDTRRIETSLLTQIPLGRQGPLALDLRALGLFMHLASDDETLADTQSTRVGAELAVIGNVRTSDRVTVRAGFISPFVFELSPTTSLASTGALLSGGLGVVLTSSWIAQADLQTGGLFGFDGDGTKLDTRIAFGVRWVSSQSARDFNLF